MTGSPAVAESILHVNFNQDQSCFCCGLDSGFRVYNCDPLKEKVRQDWSPGGDGVAGCAPIARVEMLFRCNYIALVGAPGNRRYPPNKVFIWDEMKSRIIIELEFAGDVRGVQLRRDRIVVALDNVVKVFSFDQTPQALNVFRTAPNPHGLCVLCPSSGTALLVFPCGSGARGQVQLVDLNDTNSSSSNSNSAGQDGNSCSTVISAHNTPLSCIQLSVTGCRLATASQKGTLIRVFDTRTRQMLCELRRGANHALIYCINFSQDESLLCVSSDHGTIHVFNVDQQSLSRRASDSTASSTGDGPSSPRDIVSNLTDSAVTSLVPKYFNSRCSLVRFQVTAGRPCVCAIGTNNRNVFVVSSDGSYYKYTMTGAASEGHKGQCQREMFAQFLKLAPDT